MPILSFVLEKILVMCVASVGIQTVYSRNNFKGFLINKNKKHSATCILQLKYSELALVYLNTTPIKIFLSKSKKEFLQHCVCVLIFSSKVKSIESCQRGLKLFALLFLLLK